MERRLIALTVGDPAGIGPEIIIKAHLEPRVREAVRIVAVGPLAVFERAAAELGVPFKPSEWVDGAEPADGKLSVVDVPADLSAVHAGRVGREAGSIALRAVDVAIELARQRRVDGITTAPWNKEAIELAGAPFSGHTEYFAHSTGVDPRAVTMMLVHAKLHVFHVSTHVPLAAVGGLVTTERVRTVIALAADALQRLGIACPRIAVAGLNPHAGEGGLFGHEEQERIVPAIEAARRAGVDVQGPIPGDTVFWRGLRGDFDGIVAMYHDQGHIPVKVAGMGHGVNVTVGLPIVRTSVDHGTAFDIVGRGRADATSLIEALLFAGRLAAAEPAPAANDRAGLKSAADA